MADKSIAVILVGGPTTGTNFRPISLHVPTPLFPVAGKPMIFHPISACKKIPDLSHVFVIGFYEEKEFSFYVSAISNELSLPVRYLKEDKSHGSAGGLYHFRDLLLEDSPKHVFVLHCDVCSTFPLLEMLEAHKANGGMGTLMVKKVAPDLASEYGELVADAQTNELLHYAEKPETFVSDKINCGVYVFSPELFDVLKEALGSRSETAALSRLDSFGALQFPTKPLPENFLRLDEDVFSAYAGKKKLFVYETMDFWEPIKSPAFSIKCAALYLEYYKLAQPTLLYSGGEGKPSVVGNVFVHPSAKIHSSAKIGPNVSVLSNARVGPGVRLHNCTIMEEVEIKENAIVSYAIVDSKSSVGRWSRVQGTGDFNAKLGVTVLGGDVTVEDEVVVVNCIVLPHKSLGTSKRDEIIL
eukprot:TRINITY_DN766_c0_g1_i2.p1 TRINITY_DN766_c0_g1~~TRINITY_DN766_c0_g1_i2.p1  ORF type:complete len:412 (-),score=117.95 TRINITY_DN766_c0_g1_i2:223-1458(-)